LPVLAAAVEEVGEVAQVPEVEEVGAAAVAVEPLL
jgi:hypothetical protein